MNNLITVIVPVYNVERYLPRCLDSIVHQTYEELEILLIDDGSTDSSGEICDRYAINDPRIHVVHQKNAGAGAAKNTGLRIATGEYLAFVDSDDWIEPDSLEYMHELMSENGSDIVHCCFSLEYTDRSEEQITHTHRETVDRIEFLRRLTEDWTCALLWDKLFRRCLFNGVFFEEGRVIDDEFFTYRGVMNANRILIDNKIVYHYRQRRSSATENPSHGDRIVRDKLDYLEKRKQIISSVFPELKKDYNSNYLFMMLYMMDDPRITLNSIGEIRKALGREWIKCIGSGEGIRADLKIIRLLTASPVALYRKARNRKKTAKNNLFD